MLYVPDLGKFFYELVQQLQDPPVTSPKPYTQPSGYDPLGFGQVSIRLSNAVFLRESKRSLQLLAATVAFPPLWQLLTLIWESRREIMQWIKGYPHSLWSGIVFIFTGYRNPWKRQPVEEDRIGTGPLYNSVPFTGPKTMEDEEKFQVHSLSNPAWKSVVSLESVSASLYDPYDPKHS